MKTTSRNERIEPVVTRIAHMIRMLRLIRGLSQQDLAGGLGVTFQQVQKYEKGTTHISTSRLYDIARLVGAPIEIFFRDADSDDDAWAVTCSIVDRYRRLSPQFGIHEFMELNRAFLAIEDAGVRQSILDLMDEIAADADDPGRAVRPEYPRYRARYGAGTGAEEDDRDRRWRPSLRPAKTPVRAGRQLNDGEAVG